MYKAAANDSKDGIDPERIFILGAQSVARLLLLLVNQLDFQLSDDFRVTLILFRDLTRVLFLEVGD